MNSYVAVAVISFCFGVLCTVVVPDLTMSRTPTNSPRRKTTRYKGGSVSRPPRRRFRR